MFPLSVRCKREQRSRSPSRCSGFRGGGQDSNVSWAAQDTTNGGSFSKDTDVDEDGSHDVDKDGPFQDGFFSQSIDVDTYLRVHDVYPGFPQIHGEAEMKAKIREAEALVAGGDRRLSQAEIAWMVQEAKKCLDRRRRAREASRPQGTLGGPWGLTLWRNVVEDEETDAEPNPTKIDLKHFEEYCLKLKSVLLETHYGGDELNRTKVEAKNGEDELDRTKVEAKNALEKYCVTLRNMLQETQVTDQFEADLRAKIEKTVWRTLDWLRNNQLAKEDEIEAKQKELEDMANPIVKSNPWT